MSSLMAYYCTGLVIMFYITRDTNADRENHLGRVYACLAMSIVWPALIAAILIEKVKEVKRE